MVLSGAHSIVASDGASLTAVMVMVTVARSLTVVPSVAR